MFHGNNLELDFFKPDNWDWILLENLHHRHYTILFFFNACRHSFDLKLQIDFARNQINVETKQ